MGRYVRLTADQQGVDIALTILDPHGNRLYEIDRWSSSFGPETISFFAPSSGIYEIEIQPVKGQALPGGYTLQLTEPAPPPDPARISALLAALRPYNEAQRLYRGKGAESQHKSVLKYTEALPLLEKAGDPLWEASALTYIAEILDELGERRKAFEIYPRALLLWHQAKDPDGEAETLHAIGVDQYSFGELRQALKSYEAALPLWQAAKDQLGEAATLGTIGLVYQTLGEYQISEEYLNRGLHKAELVKDYGWQAHIIHDLAMGRFGVGDFDGALTQFQSALEISKKSDERWFDNHVLHHIGEVYLALLKYDLAETTLRAALAQSKEFKDVLGEATTLIHLGTVLSVRGNKTEALDDFSRARSLRKNAGYRLGEAQCDERIGEVQFSMTRYTEARDSFDHARELSYEIGELRSEATALNSLAKVDRETGDLDRAREEALESLRLVESLRTNIRSPELRASFLSTTQDFYQTGIDVLMEISKKPGFERFQRTALEVNERARARSLLELLTESGVHIREGVPPSLLAEEQSVLEALSAKSERHLQLLGQKHRPEEAVQLSHEVRELSDRLQATQARVRVASPQYAALTQPLPLSANQIQKQVVDPNTLLLEYALGDEHSYLWAVTPQSISSFELPKREEINAAARRFYELITARNTDLPGETPEAKDSRLQRARSDYAAVAASLGRTLLGQVNSLLGSKRLLIVADSALNYIPFAALLDSDGLPLVAKHEVVNIPSGSTLAVLRHALRGRRLAPKAVAVLADPVFERTDPRLTHLRTEEKANDRDHFMGRSARDVWRTAGTMYLPRLPFTRREAMAILSAAHSGVNVIALDFDAQREKLTGGGLETYRIIHLATHGLLDTVNPDLSGLVFSLFDKDGKPQNGFLKLQDTYNLHLPAELVVLSACQTGLGKELKGEGLIGLTRGFMYAGAKRVVASLWNVNDFATAELMGQFYKAMLKDGMSPVAALRAAQLAIRAQNDWRDPYYWAAFTVQGDWK